jgi:hypothetical protein
MECSQPGDSSGRSGKCGGGKTGKGVNAQGLV